MGKNNRKNKVPESRANKLYDFQPKTTAQQTLVNLIETQEIVVASGSSGVGKTYVALVTALKLLEKGYKKIILVKSVTTIPGENIGFIPGTYEEKMEPFLMSYTWNVDKILGRGASKELMDKGLMEVMPIAYVRGLSIDDSIVIIDEAQNIDKHTFKTIITRIGENSKYIFLGDVGQVDRKRADDSCLDVVLHCFKDIDYVGTLQFDDEDCVRNPLIPKILEDLDFYNF